MAGLVACGTQSVARLDGHMVKSDSVTSSIRSGPASDGKSTAGTIPDPVRKVPLPPPPQPRVDELKYSVTVKDVPVQELMFAISRDTKVNIDIHPGIEGQVTLNAIDQTLKQILTRVAKQVDMRWEVDGPNIVVRPDSPYLKIYKIDYVNMTRDSTGTVGVQTQVVGPGGAAGGASGGAGQNSSQIRLDNVSKNRFWENLEKNIRDMLRETDKLLPEGSSETVVQNRSQGVTASTRAQAAAQQQRRTGAASASSATQSNAAGPGVTDSQTAQDSVSQTLTFREAASVIINPETGTLAVRATSRQQEKIAEFIEQIGGSSRRQVLIEATVVEVVLNDSYQSGVDWSALGLQGLGYTVRQNFTGVNLTETPFFSLQYRNPNAAVGGDISSTVKLLNSFGNTRVLSSPKIMALNNQTAVMRVVENRVYFTLTSQITGTIINPNTGAVTSTSTFTSVPNVVPEGFVMNVTPQISENDIINLNIRPSVTRITSYVNDPNPDLARTGVISRVPQIQTREFETMMRVASGQTAVLGGLMQDSFEGKRDGLPILSRVPVLGDAVSFRNDTGRKSELVVFIRALVIREASIDSDLSEYRKYLPDSQFFKDASPSVDLMNPKTYQPAPADTEREPGKAP